jgi:hypothetical protein
MISPMFDIGLGIDQDISGYENIRMRGLILGMTPDDIAGKMQDISEFTELGEYLDVPVRTYFLRHDDAIDLCSGDLLCSRNFVDGRVDHGQRRQLHHQGQASHRQFRRESEHPGARFAQCRDLLWMGQGIIKAAGSLEEILEMYAETQRDCIELA